MTTYPDATDEQIAFFRAHGYLVVEDAIPVEDLDELEGHLDELILQKEKLAFDWAWDESEDKENRSFKIVQSWPEAVWPGVKDAAFRTWAAVFGSALLGKQVEFASVAGCACVTSQPRESSRSFSPAVHSSNDGASRACAWRSPALPARHRSRRPRPGGGP